MNIRERLILFLLSIFILSACSYSGSGDNHKITEINSTNLDTLGKILDLSVYKPISATYNYTYIENNAERVVLVPGPSDSQFEAYLRFDSVTMRNLRSAYFNVDYASPALSPDRFKFSWLDEDVLTKLNSSDTSYHGHPDIFFCRSTSCNLWMLPDGVLLCRSTM